MSNLSEEEKKAIETARCIRAGIPVGTCNDDYIYLLNLIEKLEKENKQLKQCNKNLVAEIEYLEEK